METTIALPSKRKVCARCGAKRKLGMFGIRKDHGTTRSVCKSCTRKDKRQLRKKKVQMGICVKCPEMADIGHVHCAKCLKKTAVRQLAFKKFVFSKYGSICNCCGESNIHFLTIDHVYGDGNTHRKETKGGGSKSYHWLKKHDFPQNGFQLLCYNCNCGRQVNGGICPHHDGATNNIKSPRGLIFR